MTEPRYPLFTLAGKTAIITGSSRGIGRAIAERFAEAGCRVIVTSRNLDNCEAVVADIRAAGGTAQAIACNIASHDQVKNLFAACEGFFGPPDILVCNSALNVHVGSMASLSDEKFEKTMSVNVKANLWLANLAAPGMQAAGGGAIIMISSISGLAGSRTLGAYAISKAAEIQLARNLAVELGPFNVRVNSIAPGLIRTDFSRVIWENPELLQGSVGRALLGRIGEVDDVAGPALFLASDAGRYVTGQTIVVDGGVMAAAVGD
ncbi:SDR family oxidoreductase [Ochrobactrum sp. XJ1]|nr:SDR family oxidoreductase [Ochrobactrum sp. XJ1]